TRVPTGTVIVAGVKAKLSMVTATSAAAVSVAVPRLASAMSSNAPTRAIIARGLPIPLAIARIVANLLCARPKPDPTVTWAMYVHHQRRRQESQEQRYSRLRNRYFPGRSSVRCARCFVYRKNHDTGV